MKIFGFVAGVVSFLVCLTAGTWILVRTGLSTDKDNVLTVAIGLYFVGKACFVGPMLVLTAARFPSVSEASEDQGASEA